MRSVVAGLGLIVLLLVAMVPTGAQQTPDADVIAAVRSAIASHGVEQGLKTLNTYRAARGATPEVIEAMAWLARGALAAKQFDKANEYAADAYDLAVEALKGQALDNDMHLQTAVGAAIEITASIMVDQGARSEAVDFLQRQRQMYRDTSLHQQLRANIDRVTLEGHAAPRLENGLRLGSRVQSMDQLKGKVVLVFFWAHWCPECKTESPTIARLLDKYRSRGLAIVAPTQRYGYVEAGRPAPPDKELRYIVQVRNSYYSFLRDQPVPVSEANYKEYGVTSIPMHVLIDRQGIIRLYTPGRMTEEQLEAAIQKLL